MKMIFFALLLCTSFAFAQDDKAAAPDNVKHPKDWITTRGCVSRSSGDYILIKQTPAETYELQSGSGKIHLGKYLGHRVEVSGRQSPTLSSSSDALNKTGSASSIMISVKSIRTLDKQCEVR